MTRPRQRIQEDMQLRGLSARTQGCHIAAVRQLAAHYRRSPDQLTAEDLRQYFLYLANEKQVARATATTALCGIRFFFTHAVQSLAADPRHLGAQIGGLAVLHTWTSTLRTIRTCT